ncbi:MAG: sigma 54-interacting transcriptional regulator, partial [Myxococcota bacterium]|nr:sigma 54-interacting transcriptional regulator [Myxococcota bacterium]
LLRFLEDGIVRPIGGNESRELDVRLVCATHRDLREELSAGRFRVDLYHRLAGVVVELPSLRDRPADLTCLTASFLEEESTGARRQLPRGWWPAFRSYDWPGNVRELRNAMRSVVALSRGPELEARFLPEPLRSHLLGPLDEQRLSRGEFNGWTLAEVERELVRRALLATGGHRGRAAEQLGISSRALYDKLRRLSFDDAELFHRVGSATDLPAQ